MGVSLFEPAFAIVVGIEAGYVNDPLDPGGETKFGISKRAYPNEDIPNLTLGRAHELYQRDYWDKANCDALAWELALVTFDCAVNQGVGYAATLQGDAVERLAQRALRYTKSSIFAHDGHGWMKRLFNICKKAQKVPV